MSFSRTAVFVVSDSNARTALKRLGADVSPDVTKPRLIKYDEAKSGMIVLHVILPAKSRRGWFRGMSPPTALVAIGSGVSWKECSVQVLDDRLFFQPLKRCTPELCAVLADLWLKREELAERKP